MKCFLSQCSMTTSVPIKPRVPAAMSIWEVATVLLPMAKPKHSPMLHSPKGTIHTSASVST